MAYTPSLFVDRSVEFPGRRVLTPVSGMANTVDITRTEGTVFTEGTMPDATNLNAEFNKIKDETDAINNSLNANWTLMGSVTGTTQLNFTVGTYKKLKVRVYNNVTGTTMQVLEKEVDVQFLSDTRYRCGDAVGTNIQANAFFGMMVDIKLSSVKLVGSHSYTTDCTATATVELWGK